MNEINNSNYDKKIILNNVDDNIKDIVKYFIPAKYTAEQEMFLTFECLKKFLRINCFFYYLFHYFSINKKIKKYMIKTFCYKINFRKHKKDLYHKIKTYKKTEITVIFLDNIKYYQEIFDKNFIDKIIKGIK
jgi:hypothetical protein